MLTPGLMGLHALGPNGVHGSLNDLAWALVGGALPGMATGTLLGFALRWRIERHDAMARDALLYVGVLGLGLLLHSLPPLALALAFALLLVLLVMVLRPLSVFAVVRLRRGRLKRQQRRRLAWFGIRGIGSLFYPVRCLHRCRDGAGHTPCPYRADADCRCRPASPFCRFEAPRAVP